MKKRQQYIRLETTQLNCIQVSICEESRFLEVSIGNFLLDMYWHTWICNASTRNHDILGSNAGSFDCCSCSFKVLSAACDAELAEELIAEEIKTCISRDNN